MTASCLAAKSYKQKHLLMIFQYKALKLVYRSVNVKRTNYHIFAFWLRTSRVYTVHLYALPLRFSLHNTPFLFLYYIWFISDPLRSGFAVQFEGIAREARSLAMSLAHSRPAAVAAAARDRLVLTRRIAAPAQALVPLRDADRQHSARPAAAAAAAAAADAATDTAASATTASAAATAPTARWGGRWGSR